MILNEIWKSQRKVRNNFLFFSKVSALVSEEGGRFGLETAPKSHNQITTDLPKLQTFATAPHFYPKATMSSEFIYQKNEEKGNSSQPKKEKTFDN